MRSTLWWQVPVGVVLAALVLAVIGPVPAAIPGVAVAATAAELTRVDLAERRLPNRMTVPLILVGLVGAGASWLTTGEFPAVPLIAAVATAGVFFVAALAGGMGMGDVKLAAALGLASPLPVLALGWPVLATLTGGVASVAVLIRAGRRARIPFGPFLLLGYVGTLVALLVVGQGAVDPAVVS